MVNVFSFIWCVFNIFFTNYFGFHCFRQLRAEHGTYYYGFNGFIFILVLNMTVLNKGGLFDIWDLDLF